ncbi:MAG: hypothetical protein ACRDG5_10745 [Anaerolineales bacterium]
MTADPPSSNYRSLMAAAAALAAVGWIGLVILMNQTLPTVGPRWLFFFLWTMAVTGSVLPFLWLLHRRFGAAPAPASVLLRQGLWAGLFAAVCLWLQVNRSLTLPLAALLGAGLAAFEWLLRRAERSAWRPPR